MIKVIIYHLSKHKENGEVKACLEGGSSCMFGVIFFLPPAGMWR